MSRVESKVLLLFLLFQCVIYLFIALIEQRTVWIVIHSIAVFCVSIRTIAFFQEKDHA